MSENTLSFEVNESLLLNYELSYLGDFALYL